MSDTLARVLCAADGVNPDWIATPPVRDEWESYLAQAERILTDPGPLLAALAEAGVLVEHQSSRPGCRDCSLYKRGHLHRQYRTEWEPTDAR